jgi:hypothetical protein
MLRKYSDAGKRILLKKCRKLRRKVKAAIVGRILTGKVAVSQLREPDFNLEPAVRIRSTCGHKFLMDLFEPQFFIHQYLMRNLCSSFTIYHR